MQSPPSMSASARRMRVAPVTVRTAMSKGRHRRRSRGRAGRASAFASRLAPGAALRLATAAPLVIEAAVYPAGNTDHSARRKTSASSFNRDVELTASAAGRCPPMTGIGEGQRNRPSRVQRPAAPQDLGDGIGKRSDRPLAATLGTQIDGRGNTLTVARRAAAIARRSDR
jgi:hypothetical protein